MRVLDSMRGILWSRAVPKSGQRLQVEPRTLNNAIHPRRYLRARSQSDSVVSDERLDSAVSLHLVARSRMRHSQVRTSLKGYRGTLTLPRLFFPLWVLMSLHLLAAMSSTKHICLLATTKFLWLLLRNLAPTLPRMMKILEYPITRDDRL